MTSLSINARSQAEWGLYWLACARRHPEHAAACHWNSFMDAMHAMALEALDASNDR